LKTTPGRAVILAGGAKASNIFCQVESAATIDTSFFKGTIMAYAAVTLNSGATLEGRALSRTDAVTLDSNIDTAPAP
jgi:hypothetical protein